MDDIWLLLWKCFFELINVCTKILLALPEWFVVVSLSIIVLFLLVSIIEQLHFPKRKKNRKRKKISSEPSINTETVDLIKRDFIRFCRIKKDAYERETAKKQREEQKVEERQRQEREVRERQCQEREAEERQEVAGHLQRQQNNSSVTSVFSSKTTFSEDYNKSAYFVKTNTPFVDAIRTPGALQEMKVFHLLERHFPAQMLFPNVYIEWAEGKSSELDLIMLHSAGIFVFECKDWQGKISGSEFDEKWIQNKGKYDRKVHNPIRQNYGHLRSVASLFPDVRDSYIRSVIVFRDCCTLDVKSKTLVVHRSELIENLSFYLTTLRTVFNSKQLAFMADVLQQHSLQSEKVKQQHIQYVESVIRAKSGQ